MRRTRVIPALLLKGQGFVKTVKFAKPKYLGDPINILRIFNEKEVDEVIILDITATTEGRAPGTAFLTDIVSEAFMPVGYGGGITTLEQARTILSVGVEKVVLNTSAVERPALIREAADLAGSSSVVVSIDARRTWRGSYEVVTRAGSKKTGLDPVRHAVESVQRGAGEVFITAIDRDGTLQGYDTDLVARVAGAVDVPVVACGGASSVADFQAAVSAGASAVAAGSMFVFVGRHQAVLISYPDARELTQALP